MVSFLLHFYVKRKKKGPQTPKCFTPKIHVAAAVKSINDCMAAKYVLFLLTFVNTNDVFKGSNF